MRLFVSYARVDKPYCVQIVNTLDVHETWYDQRLYAGQQWWKEILRRIDWCEGFIYLLSAESVVSDYCQRELEIALSHGRQIIPVAIQSDVAIPAAIAEVQYVDLANGLNAESVRNLLNSIYVAEQRVSVEDIVPVAARDEDLDKPQDSKSKQVIQLAAEAMENERFDQAVFLIKQARVNGFKSRFINLETMLRQAELALEAQMMKREAEREYRQIVDLLSFTSTRQHACQAFAAFQKVFPDYDPEGIGPICSDSINDNASEMVGASKRQQAIPRNAQRNRSKPKSTPVLTKGVAVHQSPNLRLMDFVSIPEGIVKEVRGESDSLGADTHSLLVPRFEISRYPITNQQFNAFIEARDGYGNPEWSRHSKVALMWFKQSGGPRPSTNPALDNPREMVTWFEAIAFTQWLSHHLDRQIVLPDVAHWQRAVQCEDDRIFPWGNTYDYQRCNTRESRLRTTTSVREFPNGSSPSDVFDLAGNVWEWCRGTTHNGQNGDERIKVPVVGGSFVSPLERAHVNFTYKLDPRTLYSSIGFRVVSLPD